MCVVDCVCLFIYFIYLSVSCLCTLCEFATHVVRCISNWIRWIVFVSLFRSFRFVSPFRCLSRLQNLLTSWTMNTNLLFYLLMAQAQPHRVYTHQPDQSSYVEFSISLWTNWIVPCTTYNMQYKSIEFNKWQIKICRSLVLNRFAIQFEIQHNRTHTHTHEMKRQSYVDDGRRVRKCRPGNYEDPLSHSSSCQKCSSPTFEFAIRY